ncbi:MAG: efflux RND transporter permease subunit [Eubacteriaceae bacterium]
MFSKYSVKKPFTVLVSVIIVLILGTISFMHLQVDLLPSIDLPYVVVMTQYPGASPEEVELVVTKPTEQLLATTSNIKNINSVSNENLSLVILEFNNNVNLDSAIIEINGNLDLIKQQWSDSIGTPMILRMNPDMLPVMITAVDSEGMNLEEISELADKSIIPDLESVEGVASVTGNGLIEESIDVSISSEKIEELNKKILNSIDADLSKAEDKLLGAKKDIQSGLVQLEEEKIKQSEELAKGEEAVQLAKTEIETAQSQLDTAEDELSNGKIQIQTGLSALDIAEGELLDQKNNLDAIESPTAEEQQQLDNVNANLGMIQNQRDDLNADLEEINTNLAQVQEQQTQLAIQNDEISSQEEQIIQGKEVLDTEMTNAKNQLVQGQSTINQQINKLDDAKEEAFEKADLEGVITESMISGILTAQNFSMPAGYISEDGIDYLVKVGDKIRDSEEIGGLLLFDTGIDGVDKIYLKDVADVKNTNNSEESYAKVNGKDVVVLSFQKQSNYSTPETSDNIKEKMELIQEKYPDVTFTHLMDQGIYIDIVISSVLKNLMYGGILAVIILLLFLRDIKPTVIIALSIPISLVFTIAMMYFTNVTMNIISLGGLALGVGMLVDNSVVVIENIYRLKNKGLNSINASIEGAKQVAGALAASTLTTTAVFLPIVFTTGISKEIFADMGLTIAYSLIASLIVALTLVPAISSNIFKNLKDKEHPLFDKITNAYEGVLKKALNHKAIVMILVVVLLSVSIFATFSMGTSFIPEMEGNEMSATIEMEQDTSYDEKISMTNTVVDCLLNIEGIQSVGAFSSSGGMGGMSMGGGSSSQAMSLYVLLDEKREVSNKEIEENIRENTKDLDAIITVSSSNMNISALAGSGMEVVIKGNDIDTLREVSNDVVEMLESTQGAIEIETSFEEKAIEMRIVVDKNKAMEEGLTVAQVYSFISTSISEGKTATTINIDNKEYPVIVVNDKNEKINREDIEKLEITTEINGEENIVKIGDITQITEAEGLSSIQRENQARYVAVTASIDTDYNIGLVSKDFESKLKDYNVPDGYNVEISGETETINNTLRDLVLMVALAIVFIYLIMVAQFQSLLSPFIVMFTMPLAFTGGLLALLITGNDISVISMLGFLVLSGVVVNNGIVFVDYTNQLREEGYKTREALIETGKVRIRPILMTAITTILGLSTLSFGVGMGSEMLQPLAIVAIGGLTYATLLTLLVVPVMYEIFHKNKKYKSIKVEGE